MFKRIIALGVVLMLGVSFCYAESRDKKIIVEQVVINSSGVSIIPVASTATVYTGSFSLQATEKMAVMYKAAGSTIDLDVYLEQSYARPATEDVLNPEFIITHYIDTSLTDTKWHCATLSTLTPLPFGRFKVIGVGGNSSETSIQMRIGKQ